MYHLRKISEEGVEINSELGRQYSVIDREENAKAFVKTVEQYFPDGIAEDIYCFVASATGQIYGLSDQGQAYIMTENGSTFSNLTSKNPPKKEKKEDKPIRKPRGPKKA